MNATFRTMTAEAERTGSIWPIAEVESLIAENNLDPSTAAAMRAWSMMLPQYTGEPMPAAVAIDFVQETTDTRRHAVAFLFEQASNWLRGQVPYSGRGGFFTAAIMACNSVQIGDLEEARKILVTLGEMLGDRDDDRAVPFWLWMAEPAEWAMKLCNEIKAAA